jgi:hypothetical protein
VSSPANLRRITVKSRSYIHFLGGTTWIRFARHSWLTGKPTSLLILQESNQHPQIVYFGWERVQEDSLYLNKEKKTEFGLGEERNGVMGRVDVLAAQHLAVYRVDYNKGATLSRI